MEYRLPGPAHQQPQVRLLLLLRAGQEGPRVPNYLSARTVQKVDVPHVLVLRGGQGALLRDFAADRLRQILGQGQKWSQLLEIEQLVAHIDHENLDEGPLLLHLGLVPKEVPQREDLEVRIGRRDRGNRLRRQHKVQLLDPGNRFGKPEGPEDLVL